MWGLQAAHVPRSWPPLALRTPQHQWMTFLRLVITRHPQPGGDVSAGASLGTRPLDLRCSL